MVNVIRFIAETIWVPKKQNLPSYTIQATKINATRQARADLDLSFFIPNYTINFTFITTETYSYYFKNPNQAIKTITNQATMGISKNSTYFRLNHYH